MNEQALTLDYNQRDYVRYIVSDKVFVDFHGFLHINKIGSSVAFRLLQKLDLSGFTINYQNRKLYLESFAFSFFQLIRETEKRLRR